MSVERSTPTCRYYPNRPCARPKECSIHGQLLRRPYKGRHLLRPELETFSWARGSETPDFWRTYCGEFLYQRLDFQEETAKIKGDPAFRPDLVDDGKRQWAAYTEYRDRRPTQPSLPIPSDDPSYEVYFRVGRSTAELLVVRENPTCKACQKVERAVRAGTSKLTNISC